MSPPPTSERILIVDDEPALRRLLVEGCSRQGLEAIAAASVAEAVSLIDTREFGCALFDKNLPDGTGLELLEKLRAVQPRCAALLVTGYANKDSAVAALRLGAFDYVEKPFSLPDVLRRIHAALEKRREEDRQARQLAELEAKNAELVTLAITDPLTGLYNRRYVLLQLEREIARARRYSRPVTVVLFDVDHFKRINDEHGHGVGDEVLKRLSVVVRSVLREADLGGRYGGEEFVIVAPETDLEGGRLLAERIRLAVELAFSEGCGLPRTTVSLGVSCTVDAGPAGASPEALVELADQSMYRAKRSGRNRVAV